MDAETTTFTQWAHCVQREATAFPVHFYEGQHAYWSKSFKNCCELLEAIDEQHMSKGCCIQLSDGAYESLGEAAAAADWKAICEWLAQRVGRQAQHPAWLEQDAQECASSVRERLERACCSGEVAVLMLRLAVRAACLASSWYGPWDSVEALQQLISANAWSSLLQALRALLATFGADLAKQYNAINIVSDILHVSRALCTLLQCQLSSHDDPSDPPWLRCARRSSTA